METYLPSEVKMSFGTIPIKGVMDGTFITIEPGADTWKKKIGAQSNVGRTRIEDDSFRITITLMGSSETNEELTGAFLTDKATGAGQLPFSMKDNSGKDKFFATNTWIVALPATSKGDDILPVVWILDCERGENIIGGNA